MLLIWYKRKHYKTLMRIANSVQLDPTRTLNGQCPASLYCLPMELIHFICEYLPIAETFCLMISCARSFHVREKIPGFVHVQQRLKAKTLYTYDLIESRFHILRLMEFDKLHGKGTKSFCCWACTTTHRKSRFYNCRQPVHLKFSVEEQRHNCSNDITRSCKPRLRSIWVGMCHEMRFAELRCLVLGMQTCKEEVGSVITIPGSSFFSEHIEFNLDNMHLLSRFYLGRLSDLGVSGFDYVCRKARLPICPHKKIDRLVDIFLRTMKPGDTRRCGYCPTTYHVTITSDGFIELHILRYFGTLGTAFDRVWSGASYYLASSAYIDNCREFSRWLDRMYNPKTGAVYNGGQFEVFVPSRKWILYSFDPL